MGICTQKEQTKPTKYAFLKRPASMIYRKPSDDYNLYLDREIDVVGIEWISLGILLLVQPEITES